MLLAIGTSVNADGKGNVYHRGTWQQVHLKKKICLIKRKAKRKQVDLTVATKLILCTLATYFEN